MGRTLTPSPKIMDEALTLFEHTASSGAINSTDPLVQKQVRKDLYAVNEVMTDWVYGSHPKKP